MAEREDLGRYDQRLVEFHLRSGTLNKKDYEQYLKKLPDSESVAEYIEPFQEEEGPSSAGSARSLLTFTAAESDS